MISIDTVYQRVQALANKEQRGYITPQEYNLFANMAQMEILDQYFYDLNQTVTNVEPNSTEYSDMTTFIDEKLGVFKKIETCTLTNGTYGTTINKPNDFYRYGTIYKDTYMYEEVDYAEYKEMIQAPLTKPTTKRPIYYIINNEAILQPPPTGTIVLSYVRKPARVKWGYVVVNNKAIHNGGPSTHFELHSAEESELVYKILKLAGISLNKMDLSQSAMAFETSKVQQEKQ